MSREEPCRKTKKLFGDGYYCHSISCDGTCVMNFADNCQCVPDEKYSFDMSSMWEDDASDSPALFDTDESPQGFWSGDPPAPGHFGDRPAPGPFDPTSPSARSFDTDPWGTLPFDDEKHENYSSSSDSPALFDTDPMEDDDDDELDYSRVRRVEAHRSTMGDPEPWEAVASPPMRFSAPSLFKRADSEEVKSYGGSFGDPEFRLVRPAPKICDNWNHRSGCEHLWQVPISDRILNLGPNLSNVITPLWPRIGPTSGEEDCLFATMEFLGIWSLEEAQLEYNVNEQNFQTDGDVLNLLNRVYPQYHHFRRWISWSRGDYQNIDSASRVSKLENRHGSILNPFFKMLSRGYMTYAGMERDGDVGHAAILGKQMNDEPFLIDRQKVDHYIIGMPQIVQYFYWQGITSLSYIMRTKK